ncbi:MAG TPA: aldo/keto reductase [Methylobacterium sp.]|nr:aldo/keto reductase [Methylobacterium sp.]
MNAPHFITLNNGVAMPALGFGTLDRGQLDKVQPAVETALATGYRLIDTAAAYGNEREVGRGIAASGIARSELFVTTELWLTEYGYEGALKGFEKSLGKLGLDYVDLYLLHWPVPTQFEATVRAHEAAEKLLADGRVRAIGVANFSAADLDALAARCGTVPAVNQVEIQPYFNQHALRRENARRGIATEAWGPLGLSVRRNEDDGKLDPLQHPVIVRLAEASGKTPAQVLLRWHLQRGDIAIPKSVRPERIRENFSVFDFALSDADMAAIDALDTGERSGPDPDVVDANTFPIKVDD